MRSIRAVAIIVIVLAFALGLVSAVVEARSRRAFWAEASVACPTVGRGSASLLIHPADIDGEFSSFTDVSAEVYRRPAG